jgi:cell division septation protein DedD
MKHYFLLGLTLCAVMVFTGCKSKDSAYREAYERAKAQEQQATTDVTNQQTTTVVTPAQPQQTTTTVDHSDVRTIPGGITVVAGANLKAYSVVVGSFVNQTNAVGLMNTLNGRGYNATVVKTNETIKGQTGWFRVIASSFDYKDQAAQSRDELKASYPGAWLLYNK